MIRDFGDDLCRRAGLHVVDAIDAYPIFANPTALDLGEARVTSIDLQDVAIRDPSSDEAKRNNALMFMIGRHLFVRRFAGHADEIPLMELSADPEVRQSCRRYWARFYAEMQEVEKRMAMDEVHITGTGPAMSSQVDSDAREGRKWGLQIILASQRLDDFRNLRDLASAVFLLNAETGEIRRHTAEVFGSAPPSRRRWSDTFTARAAARARTSSRTTSSTPASAGSSSTTASRRVSFGRSPPSKRIACCATPSTRNCRWTRP